MTANSRRAQLVMARRYTHYRVASGGNFPMPLHNKFVGTDLQPSHEDLSK